MTNEPKAAGRSISAIRRNGWDLVHAERAIAALTAMLPPKPRTSDEALACELVRWLAARPDVTEYGAIESDTPAVPDHLAPVAQVLLNEDEAHVVPKLRAICGNPTAELIDILDDMEETDLETQGPTKLVEAAVLALGELGTVAGLRRLFALLELDADLEELQEVIRRAIAKTEGIVPITLELWSTADSYARQSLIEAVGASGKKHERIAQLLATWIDSDAEPLDSACAASDYGDRRLAPNLRAALARAIERHDWAARDIAACLEQLGELTEAEQKAVAELVSVLSRPESARTS